jgi:hypothetical protein
MSNPEKWAWWTLGVVVMTIAAYAAFFAFVGHGPAINSVFALLALTALPASSRRHFLGRAFDERELEIANKALRAGLGAFLLVFVALIVAIGGIKGWDTTLTVPVWTLVEVVFWAWILVLSVQAMTTIILCRDGSHD